MSAPASTRRGGEGVQHLLLGLERHLQGSRRTSPTPLVFHAVPTWLPHVSGQILGVDGRAQRPAAHALDLNIYGPNAGYRPSRGQRAGDHDAPGRDGISRPPARPRDTSSEARPCLRSDMSRQRAVPSPARHSGITRSSSDAPLKAARQRTVGLKPSVDALERDGRVAANAGNWSTLGEAPPALPVTAFQM